MYNSRVSSGKGQVRYVAVCSGCRVAIDLQVAFNLGPSILKMSDGDALARAQA